MEKERGFRIRGVKGWIEFARNDKKRKILARKIEGEKE